MEPKRSKKITFRVFGIGLFFFISSLTYPYLKFSISDPIDPTTNDAIQIIGHRGAAGLAPENTLASFQKAIDLKVDMIELDIHLSADDELIVMHDATVDRTTNGTGEIKNMTRNEIQKLDAGSWFNATFKGQKAPTLTEVIDLVNGQCKILIELKWPKEGIYTGLVKKLIKVLQDKNVVSQVIIQSFETQYLEEALTLDVNIPCHQLVYAKSDILPIYYGRNLEFGYFKPLEKVSSVNIKYNYVSENFVRTTKEMKIAIGCYTLNDVEAIQKTASWGVKYIITDYPDVVYKTLKK